MRWKPKAGEPGLIVSGVAHAALLAAGLVAFSSAPPFPDAQEGIPVEIVTDNQLSEITRGERTAERPQANPKPRAERVAERVEQRDPGEAKVDAPAPPRRPADMPVAERPVEPPPPLPVPRPDLEAERRAADAKAAEAKAVEARASEARAAEAKAAAEARARAAAEAKAAADAKAAAQARAEARAQAEAEAAELARQEEARQDAARQEAARQAAARARAKAEAEARAKREEEAREQAEAERAKRLAEAKAKQEAEAKAKAAAQAKAQAEAKARADAEARAQRQAAAADRYDPGSIQQLLQSKEASRSTGATASEVNKTAALGTAAGNAQRLNPSQRDALIGILQEQLHRCWTVPVALQSSPNPPVPSVRIRLNQDGSLAGEPAVTNSSADPLFQVAADSATRAARRCAPLRIPAQFVPYYQDWKDLRVNFNLRDRV